MKEYEKEKLKEVIQMIQDFGALAIDCRKSGFALHNILAAVKTEIKVLEEKLQ